MCPEKGYGFLIKALKIIKNVTKNSFLLNLRMCLFYEIVKGLGAMNSIYTKK